MDSLEQFFCQLLCRFLRYNNKIFYLIFKQNTLKQYFSFYSFVENFILVYIFIALTPTLLINYAHIIPIHLPLNFISSFPSSLRPIRAFLMWLGILSSMENRQPNRSHFLKQNLLFLPQEHSTSKVLQLRVRFCQLLLIYAGVFADWTCVVLCSEPKSLNS